MTVETAPNDWNLIDPWWVTHSATQSVARDSSKGGLGTAQLTDCWEEFDGWWDVYTEIGHEAAVQIAKLLKRSNEEWKRSDAPFDTDPLAGDLTRERISRGPIQPSGEVEWSLWLAQLLRPSAALVSELFDVTVNHPPKEVIRENQLSKAGGTFRRPDILVCYTDRGISIEVKLGDENYRKTSETAGLVEEHYGDQTWSHTLLLPRRKKDRLASVVDPSLDRGRDERLTIGWDDPGPIEVLYWRDVTAAIRTLLRRGDAVDSHWAANAYLFCSIAEQELLGFQSQPSIRRLAGPTSVVDTVQAIRLEGVLEEQLTYLREDPDL